MTFMYINLDECTLPESSTINEIFTEDSLAYEVDNLRNIDGVMESEPNWESLIN